MHPTYFLAILVSLAVLPVPGTAAVSSCADGVEPLAQSTEEYQFDVPIGEFTITRVCPTTAVSCMGENEDITHWLFIPNPAANGTYMSTNATTLSLCVLSNGSLLITVPSDDLSEPGNFTVTFIPTDMPETSAELQITYFPQGFYHNMDFLMTEGEDLQDIWRSYGICQDNVTLCELTGNQLAEPSDLFGPLDIGIVDEDGCGSQRPPLTYALLFNREVSPEDNRNYSLVLVEKGVCNGSEDQIVSGPVTVNVSASNTIPPTSDSSSETDDSEYLAVLMLVPMVVMGVVMVVWVVWQSRSYQPKETAIKLALRSYQRRSYQPKETAIKLARRSYQPKETAIQLAQEAEPPGQQTELHGRQFQEGLHHASDSNVKTKNVAGTTEEILERVEESVRNELAYGGEYVADTPLPPSFLPPPAPAQNERASSKLRTEEGALLAHDFEKRDKIGGGTGGVVFRGEWTTKALSVAMKKLFHVEDAQGLEICREVTILSRLRHPNIISYYGTVTLFDSYYIVTELAEEGSLRDFLRNHPDPDLQQSFRWAIEIARGVEYLHRCMCIHGDLKSGNVLLMKDHSAKICDFGSAKHVQIENVSTVQTSRTGTCQWRSPEAIRGEKACSSWDVYSYGILLWELVTHKNPFSHLNLRIPAQEFELQTKILNGERPPIPDSCKSKLTSLMQRCWSEEPSRRPIFTQVLTYLEGDPTTMELVRYTGERQLRNITPPLYQTPTMPELVRLKGERQLHNIFEEIGTRYGDFGTLLLEDSTGALIQDLERWCGNDSIRINQEILSGWLQGEGKKPVTWATLIGVLRDINMDPLADDIEDTFGDNATPAGYLQHDRPRKTSGEVLNGDIPMTPSPSCSSGSSSASGSGSFMLPSPNGKRPQSLEDIPSSKKARTDK